jgi:hypothetical protein
VGPVGTVKTAAKGRRLMRLFSKDDLLERLA